MKDVFWLIDGLMAGRPGPGVSPWDLDELRAGGIDVIISLNNQPDPGAMIAAGLRHHSFPLDPVLPVVAPLQKRLLRCIEPVLATLHAEMIAGQATLIHCFAGKDRTGLVMTAYLVRFHGLVIDEAISRVRAVRPIALSAAGYEATARRFASKS